MAGEPVSRILELDGDKFLVVKIADPDQSDDWVVDIVIRPDQGGGVGVCAGQCNGNCNGMKVEPK